MAFDFKFCAISLLMNSARLYRLSLKYRCREFAHVMACDVRFQTVTERPANDSVLHDWICSEPHMKSSKSETTSWPTVVLKGVDGIDMGVWESAWRIDPEAMSWAHAVSEIARKNGTLELTVMVCPRRFMDLTAGLTGKREIADAIHAALAEVSREICEDDYISGEVAALPACADGSVFGAHTLVVEWTMPEAYHVMCSIAHSIRNVGCIELTRLGRMGKKTVVLAVSLPTTLFNAAVTKCGEGKNSESLSRSVFDAIGEAYAAEPRPPSEFNEDEIPF